MTIPLYAQGNAMTLTVTPPLIQVNLQPGEMWTSGIQVVNGNAYPLTIYAQPLLFEPTGESGRPQFVDPFGSEGHGVPASSTLAGWITLPTEPTTIAGEQTITIPLAISVPTDAAPGGHYAAVLIGNRAPQETNEESALSVTSSIASLIFLRVAGEVVEDGRIRDFATARTVYKTPEAELSLRFENRGNVHLQPRGDITIYNMFGKKRGVIPVNQVGVYGNVLPRSMRKFTYTWKSDAGVWDIGRYRAEATLGFGAESKNFVQATTYFYILPIATLVEVVGGLTALIFCVGWMLRAYVRRAILMESRRIAPETADKSTMVPSRTPPPTVRVVEPHKLTLTTLVRPLREGMVDLRTVTRGTSLSHARTASSERLTVGMFLRQYRLFFAFVVVVVIASSIAVVLLNEVLTYERPYEVKVLEEQ